MLSKSTFQFAFWLFQTVLMWSVASKCHRHIVVVAFSSYPGATRIAYQRCSFFHTTPLVAWGTKAKETFLMMTALDEDDASLEMSKTMTSTWNVLGLKKEVSRLIYRSHKKVSKASNKLDKAQTIVEELTTNPNATLKELEACPSLEAIELELEEHRTRLQKLNEMEELLKSVKSKDSVVLPEAIASLALDLGVNDEPPSRPERGPKKQKGPVKMQAFRLPYRRYYTINKTEIRVGKGAEDNDMLSTSHKHRDGADWWMHASGCPGSHVVIRCHDNDPDDEVVQDAAALAARQSKCRGSVRKVSMTRARDVKKIPGTKAGLVHLTGKVRTIRVEMKEAERRLSRLDKTVLVN